MSVVEGLPRTSAYSAAIADDELLAAEVAKLPESKRPASGWRREHKDYSAEVEMLSAVYDRLGELCMISARTRRQLQSAPRPIKAIQRIREQQRLQKHKSLVSRVLPKTTP
jgi:hypothetical protein